MKNKAALIEEKLKACPNPAVYEAYVRLTIDLGYKDYQAIKIIKALIEEDQPFNTLVFVCTKDHHKQRICQLRTPLRVALWAGNGPDPDP